MMQVTAIVDADKAFTIALVCAKMGYRFSLSAVSYDDDDEEE